MSEEHPDLTPAEQRLVSLLMLLSEETRRSSEALTGRVMRAIRLQYLTRGFARAVGTLAAAVADGLALVFGLKVRPRDR
jgi:hypothetical protein